MSHEPYHRGNVRKVLDNGSDGLLLIQQENILKLTVLL